MVSIEISQTRPYSSKLKSRVGDDAKWVGGWVGWEEQEEDTEKE